MENVNLFILRLILASIFLSIVTSSKVKNAEIAAKHQSSTVSLTDTTNNSHNIVLKTKPEHHKYIEKKKHRKHAKKNKKSKRAAYGYKNYAKWASKSSNFGYGDYSSSLPLYLVYNRKVGAYYPFYKYPKENSVRRSSNLRRVPNH